VRAVLAELVAVQDGVICRRQALAAGLSRATIEAKLASGRWQRIYTGVYATFSGACPRSAQLWAAVLRVGNGCVLSHHSAAELVGLVSRPAEQVHVSVPVSRHLRRVPGVVIHRCGANEVRSHPTRLPPQTRVEETVIDLAVAERSLDAAVAWLARAVGGRLTTAARLVDALGRRRRVRWRTELYAALADVADGCHSLIELRYLRDVERAHALPAADRQVRRARRLGSYYDDVSYGQYRTRVELDGRAAHPDEARPRDMRRDNAATNTGDRVLRYGGADVLSQPCAVATQVATVLRLGGWRGSPRRCGRPDCELG
jgi:very-short-patch-repair endonuclease